MARRIRFLPEPSHDPGFSYIFNLCPYSGMRWGLSIHGIRSGSLNKSPAFWRRSFGPATIRVSLWWLPLLYTMAHIPLGDMCSSQHALSSGMLYMEQAATLHCL